MEKHAADLAPYAVLVRSLVCYHEDRLPDPDAEAAAFVDVLLGTLDERSAFVLRKRFGFTEPCMTLRAIGNLLGVSPERARQLEAKALRMLRGSLRFGALKQYVAAAPEERRTMLSLTSVRALARWQKVQPPDTIEELWLKPRLYRTLRKLGVGKVDDLPLPAGERPAAEKKFGHRAIADIDDWLGEYDLDLFEE